MYNVVMVRFYVYPAVKLFVCLPVFCGLCFGASDREEFDARWFAEGFPVRVLYLKDGEKYSASFDVSNLTFGVQYYVFNSLSPRNRVLMVQNLDEALKDQFLLGYDFKRPAPPLKSPTFQLSDVSLRHCEKYTFHSQVLQDFLCEVFPDFLCEVPASRVTFHPDCKPLAPFQNVFQRIIGDFRSYWWTPFDESLLEDEAASSRKESRVFFSFKGIGTLMGKLEWTFRPVEWHVPYRSLLMLKLLNTSNGVAEHNPWTPERYKKCVNFKSWWLGGIELQPDYCKP